MTRQEAVEERKRNYQLCFGSPAGKKVLEDLARVCFVSTMDGQIPITPYAPGDTNETMFRLGCHEVYRIIMMYLEFPVEKLRPIIFPDERTRIDDGNSTGYPGGPISSP